MSEETIGEVIMKGMAKLLTVGDMEMLHNQFGYEAVISSGKIREFIQNPDRRKEGRGINGLIKCSA